MFSVITCSIDAHRSAAVKAMYEKAFQNLPWEFIQIGDARSMAEGYTRGLAQSRGDMLIFSHDDIEIFSPQFPQRLQHHLETYDIIGVAGTSRLIGPYWGSVGSPYCFGQICHPQTTGEIAVTIVGAPAPIIPDIQALDGLFIAARRSVFPKVSFDAATFDGFHLYDVDFSFAAYRSGLKLAVANDICVLHASLGKYDEAWDRYAAKFQQKWQKDLPSARARQFQPTIVLVKDRAEALEVMTPPFWRQISGNHVG
jgi:hypothetical protein